MFPKKRNAFLLFIILSAIMFSSTLGYSKDVTKNATVKMNKPEILFYYYIINTQFDNKETKCQVYKPPDMRIWKKPEFGKVAFKKGVVIDHAKMSNIEKKRCKGKTVKGTEIEFTGNKKGKVSFKVEVYYRQGRYEEHIFGNVLFNVNVR